VEDGRAFCPQCRAPQIHVQVEAGNSSDAGDQPGAAPSVSSSPAVDSYHVAGLVPGIFDRVVALRAAIQAGGLCALIGIGIRIPIAGVLLAGVLAVLFYRRHRPLASGARTGLKLGAMAGAVSFAIDYLIEMVGTFVTHSQQEVIDKLIKAWQALGVDTSDPGIQTGIRIMFTPAGMMIAVIFVIIMGALLAGLSGAVTAAVVGKRTRG